MYHMLCNLKLRFEWCILFEIWSNSKKIWQRITQFNDWYWTRPLSTIGSIFSYSTSILWGRECSIYTTGESYLEYRIRSRLGGGSWCVLHVGINLGHQNRMKFHFWAGFGSRASTAANYLFPGLLLNFFSRFWSIWNRNRPSLNRLVQNLTLKRI